MADHRQPATAKWRVGDVITLMLGNSALVGNIVEDYGPLAPNKKHVYRVHVEAEPDFEVMVTDDDIDALQIDGSPAPSGR